MVEDMKVSLFLIKKKVMEYLIGLMEDNLTVNGKMESKMEQVLINLHQVKQSKVIGKMELELNGLNKLKTEIINQLLIIIKIILF